MLQIHKNVYRYTENTCRNECEYEVKAINTLEKSNGWPR